MQRDRILYPQVYSGSVLNNNHTGSNYRNWIIIRYAEILLNYAEALNEAGGSRADVLNAIQPLRDRVGMTPNSQTAAIFRPLPTAVTSPQGTYRRTRF